MAVLPDDTRSEDIYEELKTKQTHPQQFGLVRHRESVNMDRTHRYFFGRMPGLPWAKYDEFGRRIKDAPPE